MIEVIQAPEQEVCLVGCDTISVTYTLVGGEPVTVEVEGVDGAYTIEGVGTVQKMGGEWLVTDGGVQMFVAVASSGSGNRIMTSENGIDWTIRTSPADNGWKSITYGNGKFVAIANSGTNRVMKSTDGINWTTSVEAETNTWNSVTFGNGIFVAVAQDGTNRVMTSSDAVTWTSQTASSANPWTSVTFGNNLFVAVASFGGSRVMTSPDGITWTNRTASENNSWQSVTYGNGKYVAVSGNGTNQIMYSTDGTSWTSVNEPESNNWKSITYGNGKFVAISDNGTNQIMISVDGITWTSETQSLTTTWNAVNFGNGLFVAVSSNDTNRVMTSIDGETWTTRSDAGDNNWNAVTFGGTEIYATLSLDTPCPFGTYTIEEGSIFEAFEVNGVCFTSKWQAVEHPIKWQLQRKDAIVIEKTISSGFVSLELSAPPPPELQVGNFVTYYKPNGTKIGSTQINLISGDRIRLNSTESGTVLGGFVIFDNLYNNYYIETSILENGTTEIGTLRTIPNSDGSAVVDVHRVLKTKALYDNSYNYTSLTAIDLGMSGKYKLRFRACYNFIREAYGSLTAFRYWSNSAKQIRDLYGSNMAEYVGNLTIPCKFLSVFERPTNFVGYPFSLSYIVSGGFSRKLRKNENGTTTEITSAITNEGSLNRLLVSDTATSIKIEYSSGTLLEPFTLGGDLTETKQIKINQACLNNAVALSWLNTLGGREHWVFSYNQIHSIDTGVGATFEPYIDDLQNARSNVFDLERFEQPKITLGASVDIEDIRGLKTILSSICVEIETIQGWIGVRPETGTFKILETKGTTADIEFTIQLPYTNIQSR